MTSEHRRMAQSNNGGTSSRRHQVRMEPHDSGSLSSGRYDTEWEAREAIRQRELEEARARAAQMEKTMRWWSDCTANWREKWSKVRNERNKAREETKMLRSKLEAALKDTNTYKRDKVELESVNNKLRDEMERMQQLLLRDWGGGSERNSDIKPDPELFFLVQGNGRGDSSELDSQQECSAEEYVLQGAVPKHAIERFSSVSNATTTTSTAAQTSKENAVDDPDYEEEEEEPRARGEDEMSNSKSTEKNSIDFQVEEMGPEQLADIEYVHQRLSMLQLRLEESQKTIQSEREERSQLRRALDRSQAELAEARSRAEELRAARQEAARELLSLQASQQQAVQAAQLDRRDEAAQRDSLDRRLAGLRAEVGAIASAGFSATCSEIELERLQAENAAEWGKRERLETEKIGLERDNKKLRAEIRDLQERLERRGRPLPPSGDVELRQLQQDLADRGKELSDLKHSHSKLKKVLQDKSTELAHAVRRAEQYEAEVKRLRARVEELKRELAAAEDEVDSATNNIRKLQRTNDELQEQVESMQVQVRHLETSEDGANSAAVEAPSAPPPSKSPSPTP